MNNAAEMIKIDQHGIDSGIRPCYISQMICEPTGNTLYQCDNNNGQFSIKQLIASPEHTCHVDRISNG